MTNQRLDSLSKEKNDLKESLEFSQNKFDNKFKNLVDKVQKLEEKINLMTEELPLFREQTHHGQLKQMRNWLPRRIAVGKIT